MYLCGYAVEMALKARICRTLHWGAYPSTRAEFQEFQSLRTHNLITLLKLSGVEDRIRTNFVSEWSGVAAWDPEARYKPIGTASRRETQVMIESAQVLIRKL